MPRKKQLSVGTFDFETDPFDGENMDIKPFAACVWRPNVAPVVIWGDSAVTQVVDWCLAQSKPLELYTHNGGGFDFQFLFPHVPPGEISFIGRKIAKLKIGMVTFVDSLLLLPFSLDQYKKTKIDYNLFFPEVRDTHRELITNYMVSDCKNLYEVVTGFHELLGKKLTIASAALAKIAETGVTVPRLDESHDDRFRPYFFGGRVQAFDVGYWINRPFVYVDVNSAYPNAMRMDHASGRNYRTGVEPASIMPTGFYTLRCVSDGAFPARIEGVEGVEHLEFPADNVRRLYHVTGHELVAAFELDLIQEVEYVEYWHPEEHINFSEFVDTNFANKKAAKKSKSIIDYLAYKYLLNSGYGKLAIDPRKFKDYYVAPWGEYTSLLRRDGYHHAFDVGLQSVWEKSAYTGKGFYDVATAASITGYQRAVLLRALHASTGLLYCDTDCVVAEKTKVEIGGNLGQWSIEGTGTEIAVAGKKMYACNFDTPSGSKWKTATKGARLNVLEIVKVARGQAVLWNKQSPAFSIRYGQRKVQRVIKRSKKQHARPKR